MERPGNRLSEVLHLPSRLAQCLRSQVANGALRRRGLRGGGWQAARAWVRDRTGQAAFLRSARAGPSTQVRWRQVKVLPAFSKGRYVPVGRCPAADRGGSREAGVEQRSTALTGAAGGRKAGQRPHGAGARWAPFSAGLRCHFGRCWASATGRQHPRRQARPRSA